MKRLSLLLICIPFLFASCVKNENKVHVFVDHYDLVDSVNRTNFGDPLLYKSNAELKGTFLDVFEKKIDSRRINFTDNRRSADIVLSLDSITFSESVRQEYADGCNYDLSTLCTYLKFSTLTTDDDNLEYHFIMSTTSDHLSEETDENGDTEINYCRTSFLSNISNNLTKVRKRVKVQAKNFRKRN